MSETNNYTRLDYDPFRLRNWRLEASLIIDLRGQRVTGLDWALQSVSRVGQCLQTPRRCADVSFVSFLGRWQFRQGRSNRTDPPQRDSCWAYMYAYVYNRRTVRLGRSEASLSDDVG